MSVVTRFAPSPTGFLHIGGARTALFNWLFARHNGGTFLLRIEDTDRARSTDAAVEAILDGLKWLELDWDGEAVSQFERRDRHAEVAHRMLETDHAYRCYASQEELEAMRAAQKAAGQPMRYDGRWRDRDPSEAPAGVAPVIRLKAPQEGETVLNDHVQGEVRVQNAQLDDMVLLRADGTPTYMLSVVVDDHDMNVTHVIRGDDHLTNTFRQVQIYRAMGWDLPEFAHIPLIHGADGAKLSKRHGALGVDAYRDMGYLPEAVRNYLLRLGWGHGDDEIISTEQAIEWFDLGGIGRSPSRFDFGKLDNLNAHYMRLADDARLIGLITPMIETRLGRTVGTSGRDLLTRAMPGLKQRAKTLVELADSAQFYVATRPLEVIGKAADLVTGEGAALLADLAEELRPFDAWSSTEIETKVREFAENRGLKLGKVAQPLRAALSGSTISPPIFEVAELLGKTETLARIADVAQPR
ncbi:glutamate--tRNA ligase [Skermanella pratensis]|uniref:glutamate--tRNA ligase n=1 Tax=Skermanella pratensis TaxID=2233999 RepID=UPI001300EC06|nr:glutamate--tRNA ligase [Skermanella pratensis]